MKKVLAVLVLVALVLAVAVTAALAQYPGTVLWKEECPPWATLRITYAANGWHGVECFTFDATGKR
jgi:opacity protein-like surface antigen